MVIFLKKLTWSIFNKVDRVLKFPNLKPNEIGIQLGFDMGSPVTSDLFAMYKRVQPKGTVYGIDPDLWNHEKAQNIINSENYNIKLVHRAVFSNKGEVELAIGEKKGWNQLKNIPLDSTVRFTDTNVIVPMDTLDNIIEEQEIDISKIAHINITINGSEYYALLGMKNLLSKCKNINLTIVAGRYDESGYINGKPDFEMILELLTNYGFNCKFKRIHQLIWWSFFVKLLLNRKWVYGKNNYGIIIASKGTKKIKWYQSFS